MSDKKEKKEKKDKKEGEGVQMSDLNRQQVVISDGAEWSDKEKRVYTDYIYKAQVGLTLCRRERKKHKRVNLILAICGLLLPYIITVLNVSGLSAKIEDNKDLVTSVFSISIILSVFESIIIAVDKLYEPSVSAVHYEQVIYKLGEYKFQLNHLLSDKAYAKVHPYSNPVLLSNQFSTIMAEAEDVIVEVEQRERKRQGKDNDDDDDS
jgi:hypothetical protein